MRKKQEKILVGMMGSGLSPLLDGSSTVSLKRKQGNSINLPIHAFNTEAVYFEEYLRLCYTCFLFQTWVK